MLKSSKDQQILQLFHHGSFSHKRMGVILAILLVLVIFLGRYIVNSTVDEAMENLEASFQARAESLGWAIEGAARYSRHGKRRDEFSGLLEQMGTQPGIAWLAVTSMDGVILYDNNPALVGVELYSSEEMKQLAPANNFKGRFSPDEPTIYELWKIFHPDRLHRGSQYFNQQIFILFIAFDAVKDLENLDAYAKRLNLATIFISVSLIVLVFLLLYIQNYRASRKSLQQAFGFAGQLIANYGDGLLVITRQGPITLYNNKIKNLFNLKDNKNYTLDELGGFDWSHILEMLNQGLPISDLRGYLTWPGKAPIPFELSATPIGVSKGKALAYLMAIRELGETARLRLKLAEANRLATLGNMAAGLAHEIRNPLSSIQGYAAYLSSRLENDGIGKQSAQLMVEEIQRLNGVLENLLHIAKPRPLHAVIYDLTKLLGKVIAIIQPDADVKSITLNIHTPEHAYALVDSAAFIQALLNILLNAIQFTPKNGIITVTLELKRPGTHLLPLEFSGQEVWCIIIQDSGPGIKVGDMEEIFTPYYTTRPNGVGLGLPIARQIINAHNGLLVAANTPIGAAFTVFIPGHTHETNS